MSDYLRGDEHAAWLNDPKRLGCQLDKLDCVVNTALEKRGMSTSVWWVMAHYMCTSESLFHQWMRCKLREQRALISEMNSSNVISLRKKCE
jgi:hypothetical protein